MTLIYSKCLVLFSEPTQSESAERSKKIENKPGPSIKTDTSAPDSKFRLVAKLRHRPSNLPLV